MKKLHYTVLIVLFIGILPGVQAQDNKSKAHDLGMQAVKLEDEGKFKEALDLLQQAQKLDPDNIDFPYEMGYTYYAQKDYKKAVKCLENLRNHPQVYDQIFQLLGNAYDDMGKSDKALETYDAGIKLFPHSGKLFLEKGNVYWQKKEYGKALPFYEQGISAEPEFASNYYRAARIYCHSDEEVWGMIYGEIFMNLERNSARTAEISQMLYNTYKNEIKITSDTSFTVSFSKSATINIDNLNDPNGFKLPYGIGVYEPTMMMSLLGIHTIDLNTLSTIRSNFVEAYFQNGQDKKYPNVLFSYQRKLKELGFLDAYNHWILMKGDEEAFSKWQSENKDKWDSFVKWFSDNPIEIGEINKFVSGQY